MVSSGQNVLYILSRHGHGSRAGDPASHDTSAARPAWRACETRATALLRLGCPATRNGRAAGRRKSPERSPEPEANTVHFHLAHGCSTRAHGRKKHGMPLGFGRPLLRCDVRSLPRRNRTLHGWPCWCGACPPLMSTAATNSTPRGIMR
jgi:hypothetical protein